VNRENSPAHLEAPLGSTIRTTADNIFHSNQHISNEQFRLMAENIPTLCWMAEADGYIIWYNRRWHEYCGSTPAEMEGWGWQSVHDPAALPGVMERWTDSIKHGTAFEMTFPLRGSDGIFRPFLTRISPIHGPEGVVVNWFGVNTDITAQIEAEAQLKSTNSKLQALVAEREAILGQLGEGVIVTDPEGKITFVNTSAVQLHGVARLDVAPDDYAEAYSLFTEAGEPHPVDTLPLTRAIHNLETVVDARWCIRRPDGTEILAIGNAQPVYGDQNQLLGAVLTIRDDTKRRADEMALAEALKIKDILLHEVNHRVKNSLQMVISLLTLQAGKSDISEVKQSLLEACSRISVIAGMHQRLYVTSEYDSVDLAVYLKDLAAETIATLDNEERIDFQFNCPQPAILTLDEAVPLAMVISELLTNAMKYAFPKNKPGSVAISIVSDSREISVSITDNGCGIPDDFDIVTSKGLGMRIVTALTKQINGTLELVPQEAGTMFLIKLPVKG
jgi:two-component system, sensor histidine kinase PdtaS